MPRTLLALTLALLMLAPPTAAAAWFSTVEIEVAPYREGDLLRVRTSWTVTPAEGDAASADQVDVMLLEGPSRAADKFGVEHDTFALRLERHTAESEEPYGERCHLLAGGHEPVRHEVLYGSEYADMWQGPAYPTGLLGLDEAQVEMTSNPVVVFWGECPAAPLGRTTFREGDRVRGDELFPSEDFSQYDAVPVSEPAEATEFHGREALRLRFLAERFTSEHVGHTDFVVAHGLPGIVLLEDKSARADGSSRSEFRRELEGYTPGHGAPVPAPVAGRRLPERNAAAEWTQLDPLAVDDAAYGFAYPYAEALQALRNDPQMSLRGWLDRNPDARLVYAWYDASARNAYLATEATDGGWSLTFAAGDDFRTYYTSRSRLADDGGLPVALPKETARFYNFDQGRIEGMQTWNVKPYDETPVASSATLLALAQQAGMRTPVKQLWFGLFPGTDGHDRPFLALRDVSINAESEAGTEEGLNVNLALETGALTNVYATQKRTQRESFLPLAEGVGDDRQSLSALAALAGPGVGAGLAAGGAAATGLALLVVLVKFLLVPLFTRLRRDALLDNPVRARLYERVRTDPGIHLSELVDFAGIGYGATRHHLAHLVKHRLLTQLEVDGKSRYYASGEVPPSLARHAALLRHETTRRVYELLAAEPSMSLREAARRLDLSAPSVHRIKKKLEAEGLLPAAADGAVSAA